MQSHLIPHKNISRKLGARGGQSSSRLSWSYIWTHKSGHQQRVRRRRQTWARRARGVQKDQGLQMVQQLLWCPHRSRQAVNLQGYAGPVGTNRAQPQLPAGLEQHMARGALRLCPGTVWWDDPIFSAHFLSWWLRGHEWGQQKEMCWQHIWSAEPLQPCGDLWVPCLSAYWRNHQTVTCYDKQGKWDVQQ